MTHPSKRKGNAFERELVRLARDSGLEAQRAYASNGLALGEAQEVDVLVAGLRIQAKRRKKVASFLQVPDGCDAVCFREDCGQSLVLIPFAQLIELLRRAQS